MCFWIRGRAIVAFTLVCWPTCAAIAGLGLALPSSRPQPIEAARKNLPARAKPGPSVMKNFECITPTRRDPSSRAGALLGVFTAIALLAIAQAFAENPLELDCCHGECRASHICSVLITPFAATSLELVPLAISTCSAPPLGPTDTLFTPFQQSRQRWPLSHGPPAASTAHPSSTGRSSILALHFFK